MEFFLLYLFVMIEKLAAFLAIGGGVFLWASASALSTYLLSFLMSKSKEEFEEYIIKTKRYRRWSTIVAFFGMFMFVTSNLLPTKKDLAIIVAGGMTYNVLTSEPAKEIGGKALELLRKQMDDALKDDSLKEALKEKAKQEIKDAVAS